MEQCTLLHLTTKHTHTESKWYSTASKLVKLNKAHRNFDRDWKHLLPPVWEPLQHTPPNNNKQIKQTKTNLTLIMRCIVTIIYPAWGIIFRARPRLMQKPLPVANQKAILVCKHKNQRSSSKSISHCWVYCQSHPPSCFPFLLQYYCRTSDIKISLLIGQYCVRNHVIIIMI